MMSLHNLAQLVILETIQFFLLPVRIRDGKYSHIYTCLNNPISCPLFMSVQYGLLPIYFVANKEECCTQVQSRHSQFKINFCTSLSGEIFWNYFWIKISYEIQTHSNMLNLTRIYFIEPIFERQFLFNSNLTRLYEHQQT